MGIAERLQELRKSNHYSQEDIASKLDVSRQAISKWESGQGNPEIGNIIKLAEIYEVTTDYILIGKNCNVNPAANPPAKEMSRTFKRMFAVIAVIGATAVITVLFILALFLLGKFVFAA
ncbi:MAG: helix-turn-helix transcriptional regulator [Lachnospiraceae bacterium]|nr:helix-turn-helix transcriptional regulator [Lachnospiraceae bacterium]